MVARLKETPRRLMAPESAAQTAAAISSITGSVPRCAAPVTGSRDPALKILLIDDESIIREIGSRMLAFLGHVAETAQDEPEATLKYRRALDQAAPYDLVIVDLTIPGGRGGKDIIERLKAVDSGVRAFVTSGYSNDPVMLEPQHYGFLGALYKPFSMQELNQILEFALTRG